MNFLIWTGFIPRLRAARSTARCLLSARWAWRLACAHQPARSRPIPPPSLPACQPPPACSRLPTTASQSPTQPAKWENCQKGKPKKEISPNPNEGGTAAQIWNLPNLEGVDKQSNITNNASTAKVELK
ncbi:hypothetical protein DSO57_1032279 [Entomophthora muscae]|uniref:Uncharacterized protein n=1 Tax=Entomophthora muscae TaxID=34485 RepID=A0ACC2SPD1_9FUNG|nr:hypothetical protein DSO57_1032279 [Entomophthora muscae]